MSPSALEDLQNGIILFPQPTLPLEPFHREPWLLFFISCKWWAPRAYSHQHHSSASTISPQLHTTQQPFQHFPRLNSCHMRCFFFPHLSHLGRWTNCSTAAAEQHPLTKKIYFCKISCLNNTAKAVHKHFFLLFTRLTVSETLAFVSTATESGDLFQQKPSISSGQLFLSPFPSLLPPCWGTKFKKSTSKEQ